MVNKPIILILLLSEDDAFKYFAAQSYSFGTSNKQKESFLTPIFGEAS